MIYRMNPIASNGLGERLVYCLKHSRKYLLSREILVLRTIIAKTTKLQTLSINHGICTYKTVLLLAEQNQAYEMHYNLTEMSNLTLLQGFTQVNLQSYNYRTHIYR